MKTKTEIVFYVRGFGSAALFYVFIVFAVVAYCLIGIVMAVPYTYLSGRGEIMNAFIPLFLPAVSILLLTLLYLIRFSNYRDKIPRWANKVFWGLLIWALLPIIANGFSIALLKIGFVSIGKFIFDHRYKSLIVVPIVACVGRFVFLSVKDYWKKYFGGSVTTLLSKF